MGKVYIGDTLNELYESTGKINIYRFSKKHNYDSIIEFESLSKLINYLSSPPFGNFHLEMLNLEGNCYTLGLHDDIESQYVYDQIIILPDGIYKQLEFETYICKDGMDTFIINQRLVSSIKIKNVD